MKTLSLIIPVYNGEKYLERALKSALRQTIDSMEIIIIDDGSKDSSFEIMKNVCRKFNKNHFKIRIIRQKNTGVSIARNSAIKLASGEYVMFMDQDDVIAKNHCKTYMDAVSGKDYDVVVGGYRRVKNDGTILKTVRLSDEPWAKFIVTAPWAHIFKKSFLIDNDIEFLNTGLGEDVYMNLLAYAYAKDVKIIKDIGYKWVYNEASVSNSKQNTINKKADPMVLLSALSEKFYGTEFFKDVDVEYFFMRYICWYMLFSCRGSRKDDIEESYEILMDWLNINFPKNSSNPYIGSPMPDGERTKDHLFVMVFYSLRKFKLLLPFLKIFGV